MASSGARFNALRRGARCGVPLFLVLVAALACSAPTLAQREAPQCSIDAASFQKDDDPDLHEMAYDVGDGAQVTRVYVEPDVTTYYPLGTTPPANTKVKPKFNGLSGKFINMSNKPVSLYW
jgi:hypothetical protein